MLRIARLISLTLLAPSCLFADIDSQLSEKLEAVVFKVEAIHADGGSSLGSAVLIGSGTFVTNCHVTRYARKIELRRGDEKWAAQPVGQDVEHDLCFLSSANEDAGVQVGNTKELHLGQRVIAVGFSGGQRISLTEGMIRGLHDYDGARVVQTSAQFDPGASGGGLFDGSGKLVAILTFRAVTGGEFHYALPVEWFARVTAPHPHEVSKAFWERSGDKQPYFMQAAALEVDGNWRGLLEIGRRWIEKEATNPHSWLAIGLAYFHLNQKNNAILAFRKAAWLDPGCADTVSKFAPITTLQTAQVSGF